MERTGTYLLIKEADATRIFDYLEKLERLLQILLNDHRPVTEDDYIGNKRAQEYLGVSYSTLYRLSKSNQLAKKKIGKGVRYKFEDVKALLTKVNV